MRLIRRYMIREIGMGVFVVLLGFLGLTAFYDLINELDDIGHGTYRVQHAVLFVLLAMPSHIYELMPVASLIGCIYALAQFASTSEFTAMRAAGMSRGDALKSVIRIGIVLAVVTGVVGEWLAPVAQNAAKTMRAGHLGEGSSGSFRSGFWIKDSMHAADGTLQSTRFVNIGQLRSDGVVEKLEVHDFDPQFRLRSVTRAARAEYLKPDARAGAQGDEGKLERWRLAEVEQTEFSLSKGADGQETLKTRFERQPEIVWESELNPGIIAVLAIEPDSMSVLALWRYTQHLRENGQNANRYELAMWKKLIYPFAIVVMLLLALPFGYVQARAGSVGLKLFIGVMLGVVFFFMNGLFTNLGLLNTWPPWIAVSIPSVVALVIALTLLRRVGRSY